ncbi:MAG: 2-C-methyl-D-erythritol 2,4-cyclodiphosphate synthase [Chlamydiae bacterium SM23_39]|nr:MAG: 2-C-methyl-D-erythritol 2,4-cyclodiphosphate synthase [Chlamydiae bacterium SM23_39]
MKDNFIFITGIGQDSHRFLFDDLSKPCIIGGVIFENIPGLLADSDGDVVYHAICNAITSLNNIPILKGIADVLCKKDGITDSKVYLEKAMMSLKEEIVHVAIAIEGKRPFFQDKILEMRKNISSILKIGIDKVGISATSGDGLTDFGCGEGVQCFCIITAKKVI